MLRKLILAISIVSFLSAGASKCAFAVPAEVAWFKLNDDAANTAVADSSATAANGTSSTNTSNLSAVGRINDGFQFNESAKVDCGDHSEHDVTTAFTIMHWYKRSSHGATNGYTFTRGSANTTNDEYGLMVNTSGYAVAYRIVNNSPNRYDWAQGSTNLDDGNWHHIVGRYTTAVGMELWVDGAHVVTDATNKAEASAAPFPNLYVGGLDYASYPTGGLVDDARLFTEALSDAQIGLIYNGGAGTESSLADLSAPPASRRIIS